MDLSGLEKVGFAAGLMFLGAARAVAKWAETRKPQLDPVLRHNTLEDIEKLKEDRAEFWESVHAWETILKDTCDRLRHELRVEFVPRIEMELRWQELAEFKVRTAAQISRLEEQYFRAREHGNN